MPIEIYKDPETGEERRRWVAPKGMAIAAPPKPAAPAKPKPAAPAKPKDSGFDLGDAVGSLVKNTAQVLTNPAAAVLPVMGLVQQASKSPATQGALESVGRTVMYGGRQFLQETNDFINDELAKTGLTQRTTAQKPDAPFLGMAPLPKVETQHPAEAIIGNILGYGIGFAVTRKAMGAAGRATAPVAMRTPLAPVVQQAQKARAGVQALRNTPLPAAGQAGRTQALAKRATGFAIEEGATGAVAGAITTYAFQDPWSGNFSDLLKGTPLESPFSRFTQTNPNDKAEEARLKNAVTDFVYGIPLGIGIGAASAGVKAATAKYITKTAKLAATVDNAAAKGVEAPAPEVTVTDVTPPQPRRINGYQQRQEPTLRTEPTPVPDAEGRVEPTMAPEVEQARKELEDAQVELQNEVAKELEPPVAPQTAAPVEQVVADVPLEQQFAQQVDGGMQRQMDEAIFFGDKSADVQDARLGQMAEGAWNQFKQGVQAGQPPRAPRSLVNIADEFGAPAFNDARERIARTDITEQEFPALEDGTLPAERIQAIAEQVRQQRQAANDVEVRGFSLADKLDELATRPKVAPAAAEPGRPLVKAGAELSHGTSEAGRKGILAEGFRTSEYERSGTVAGEGVYMTPSERYAGEYGGKRVGGALPEDAKILDWAGSDQTLASLADEIGIPGPRKVNKSAGEVELDQAQQQALKQWALDNGYDGIQYRTNFTPGGKATEVVVYNTDLANRIVGSKAAPAAPAAPAAEPSVPSAGTSASVGPTPQEIKELDDLLAKARVDLSPEERIILRDQALAQKYGTDLPPEPLADGGAGSPPEPPEPVVGLAIEPPDPEDFARRINDNIDAMRNGDMDLQEAMSGDVRRYISRSGQTIYRPSAPEEMIATNKALSDMLSSRAEATGIASYNVEEIYQQAARRLAKDGLHVETTVKRLEAARAGDPRSQEDLISHAAVILHRDEVANQNGIAAIEFQNATDEASKADAMRRLWAGYEDQIKLDTALMTATRKDAQRLRLNQGPERKTFVNAQQLPEGSILRHGTSEEAGQAILSGGFRTSGPDVGILGDGVYFTTKDTYAGAYGDVEVYGDMPGDIRIFDLFAMDKSMAEFLRDLGLGRLDKDGLINQQQKDAIRQWATDNGYQGIRFEADFGSKPNKSGVDEVIIYDPNNANRVVGSDAAVPPAPDLPDETVQEIVDRELQDPANSLLDKLDPEIRADIEEGVLGPDAEELTDTLARVAITSRDVKGFASKFGSMAKEVPTGKLTQDLVLQMYRGSLLWSMKTWMKMALGSAYRSTTLPAAQAFGALADAARQGVSGNAQGAANALRRAGLDMNIYLQYMSRLPHAMRLAGHALREGESFGNLGRSQMEVAQKGFSEVDQMALDGAEFAQTGARQNTMDNPYFLNPESKNMVALATRAIWKVANLSGRVAGSLDTFYSSLVGPSAEWARLMDLQLRQADDLGMEPGKAWQWASDKTDELLDAQWAKVVMSGNKTVENGALTGKHAQVVMDWVNFTDPLDIKFQDRSLEYGIRKAKDEGLTDAADISARALEWTKETPDAWQRAGLGTAKVVSLAPKLYQDAVNQVPVLGMIQAFNRGPTNITKAAMRASGFASPLVDTFWRDINSEDAFTRDRAIGEIAVGWLTAVSAVTLATSGYVELTGPGSYSPQVRQKMKMDGYRPFAIRFRNPWTNEWSGYWDLTPYDSVATVFAGVATYMNAANNIPAENREALANNLVLTIAESIRQVGAGQFSKGMYGGISDIFEMLSDLESGNFIPVKNQIGSFDAYIQKKLTGFMPAVFRNVRRGQDPYERVIPTGDWPYPFNGLQELGFRFMNEIPGLSEKLPPNLHPLTANPIPVEQVWGTNFIPPEQPWLRGLVQGASPTAGMPYTMGSTDPVDNELRRLSGRGTAFIIWNTNEFQLPNYRLSIQQLNRIKEITRDYVPPGRMTSLHGSLTTLVTSPEYMSLPTPEPSRATESARAIQVNQEINYYKQYIKTEFRAQDPEVDQMLQKIENTKTMNQNDAQIGVEAWTQRMTR